ncbi:MAG: HAMP domain-containing sensor histidine kinase [Candidatus Thorarchaeota archaeon]|jgi:signal transduction histidine kinase
MAKQEDRLHVVKRVWSLLTEPHPSIQGIRKRQQVRLLSTLLLLAIPIFGFVQFTSELIVEATLTYLGASIAVFIVYLVARTQYYNIALAATLSGFTIVPIVIFLFWTRWQPTDLSRLIIWIFVALVAGVLLSRTRVVLLQGISMVSLMSFIILGVFEIPFSDYDSHFGTALIIISLMVVASYMLESYVKQIDYHVAESERKARDLEVYTQLLRHDLRNDLQAILSSLEIAEMFLEINNKKVKETLSQSLSLGHRMAQLLHIFSMPIEIPSTDLVEQIKDIALESQETFSNLRIEVSSTPDVHNRPLTTSRLLPMVWMNIFRNAAQYGGDSSIVNVDISMDNGMFLVVISDNGPGIPEDKKEWLFKRGPNSDSVERGLGLYLSRIVLESHKGSIELADQEGERTKFIIRIPARPC